MKVRAGRVSLWAITAVLIGCWSAQTAAAESPQAREHWAYQTPERPSLPIVAEPQQAREPVDLFILAELARHNLQPSAAADRATLLRRATLVLHGLLPSVDELQSFHMNRAPDAYEQELDRLLGSPHYGQRMASDWLDLARYADTHGFHADTEREQWRWRDWVIEQLMAGQPFDQFTIEQLAGDLLPGATLSQRIATGFLRNHMLNDENGAIPEEFLSEYAMERVHTIGTTWLGQTFACARCHDHKYDPLSQRKFYGLIAIFNNLQEPALLVKGGTAEPRLKAPTREQQTLLDQLSFSISFHEQMRNRRQRESAADQARWEEQAQGRELAELPGGAVIELPLDAAMDGRVADLARVSQTARIVGTARFSPGKFGQALMGDGATHLEMNHCPDLRGTAAWTLSLWLFPTTRDGVSLVSHSDEALYYRGVEWSLDEGQLQVRVTRRRETDELVVRTAEQIDTSRWQHLAVTFDPRAQQPLRLWRNGEELKIDSAGKLPANETAATGPLRIGGRDAESSVRGMLDDVRLFARALAPGEIQLLAGGNPIASVLRIPVKDRTAEQRELLQRYYLEHHDAEHRKLSDSIHREQARRDLLLQQVPTVLAAQELPRPRETFVLVHGRYDQPGERVSRQVPDYLTRPVRLNRLDRLGFAQWLVDPRHPLTSRVGANRAWAQVFGQGLVTTPEDFGTRASLPSHPALLEFISRDWVAGRWDTKRLHRRLLSSATFRQQSNVTPALAQGDPENRWLARGPRGRLSAEQVRDVALDAAGLLNAAHGGPGVKPYQPGDLWKDLAYDTNTLTAQTYAMTGGGGQYRRSVYLFWKRTAPPVNLTAFDAPSRETCTVSRGRTNSPQQALVLLNDPTFVEAARELAVRVLTEKELSADQRIDRLMLRVLSREATADERAALMEQLTADLAHFAAHPQEAEKLLNVGQLPPPLRLPRAELAAWANLATVVLNLDEAITNH
jgi:hypothetical protein